MKRLTALLLACAVHLLTLAFVALGSWVIVREPDSVLWWFVGLLCLAVGWALRPRLGRLPADAEPVGIDGAPELHALARRVAAEIGVRPPATIAVVDLSPETSYDRVGVARTPVLLVGLPLWLALPPRQRVALLATAYARLPTGDERVVSEALYTLDAWRDALLGAAPLQVREQAQERIAYALGGSQAPDTTYDVATFLGRVVGRVLGGPVLLLRYMLSRLARSGEPRVRARQRALARRAVPEEDLAELDEQAAGGRYLAPMQAAALRGESVAAIRAAALTKFQLTADGVLPSAPPSELLGVEESERIDEELAHHYARAVRGFGLIS
ncbi:MULTISPECIES: hypothetical protein [Nonomuraea]|uniref:Peptidase M48 domain-containing protein n=1 Tax=Nonomuraea salmonea TaxID=46181 RepID=A0ABV5NL54_9ACTN